MDACEVRQSQRREMWKAQADMVAALSELVDTVTAPCRDVRLFLPPEYLQAALCKFTWTLRDTLEHSAFTSVALPALTATPRPTWADVRAATRACQKAALLHLKSSIWLIKEVTEVLNTWKHEAMMATSQVGATTRRGHWLEEALRLLVQLAVACGRIIMFPWELLYQLDYIKAVLKGTEKVAPKFLKALVVTMAKVEQLCEASASLTTHHLLGTLEDIYNLLSRPGPVSPGGPSGRSVAKRHQAAVEDIQRLCKKQRTAPSCGETNWNLEPHKSFLTGYGGVTRSQQSKSEITVTGPEGKTADIRPYVVWNNSTVWGRDVMFQWGTKMEVDS
ncbi:uncharacterized protein [Chamaea fasciata]|uniref:uncharacterized protein n=1 Tax=Chamaea fasciata TaxID=190680 RepID=UPI00336A005C